MQIANISETKARLSALIEKVIGNVYNHPFQHSLFNMQYHGKTIEKRPDRISFTKI